jgi:RNA polymerase sigma factor (sigma-70 family)
MNEKKFLTEQFEANRTHLRRVAYRMLGSMTEADDAVQEAWLRFSRAHTDDVGNLAGWLTTVVSRVCLDMLRSRTSRREDQLTPQTPEPVAGRESGGDPEHDIVMADSVGAALLVVLERLAPAERLAFVLHDMFGISFDEIAPIVDRTPEAARQLASRARRRVQGTDTIPARSLARQREIVNAFLAASRGGDFNALLAVLDPDVVFRADKAAVQLGAMSEIRGAEAVANTFKGRAQGAVPALVDGVLGLVVKVRGRLHVVLNLTIAGDRITAIEAVAESSRLNALDLAVLRKGKGRKE